LQELLDRALQEKSLGNFDEEHALLERALAKSPGDPVVLRELALAKRQLAKQLSGGRSLNIKKRLNREAAALLRRSIEQSPQPSPETAWNWFFYGETIEWLHESPMKVEEAYVKATELLPGEERFRTKLEAWQARRASSKQREVASE
jgi:tetratricopeptide (TPR) repeat protein